MGRLENFRVARPSYACISRLLELRPILRKVTEVLSSLGLQVDRLNLVGQLCANVQFWPSLAIPLEVNYEE
jgi:hypothetical protein